MCVCMYLCVYIFSPSSPTAEKNPETSLRKRAELCVDACHNTEVIKLSRNGLKSNIYYQSRFRLSDISRLNFSFFSVSSKN